MPSTTTTFGNALKDYYEGPIIDQLARNQDLVNLFEEEVDDGEWDGKNVIVPLLTADNEAVGAVGEGSVLPEGGNEEYQRLTIGCVSNVARILLSGEVIRRSTSNRAAFITAMEGTVKSVVRRLARDRNRQCVGSGIGALARVSAVSGQTITVKDPGVVDTGSGDPGLGTTFANRFFNKGQRIVAMAATLSDGAFSSPTFRGITTVSTVVTTGAQAGQDITVTGSTTGWAANDFIVRAHQNEGTTPTLLLDTAANKEYIGLAGLVDDTTVLTTVFGLSRSTVPVAKSYVRPSVGVLSDIDLLEAFDNTHEQSGEYPDLILSHYSARRQYLQQLSPQRMFVNENVMTPDAGFKDMGNKTTYGGVPWWVDKDIHLGLIYGVNKKHMRRWINNKGEWERLDGDVLHRLDNKRQYEGRFFVDDAIGVKRFNTHFRLDGVTVTVTRGSGASTVIPHTF